jgi:hypothetical protein
MRKRTTSSERVENIRNRSGADVQPKSIGEDSGLLQARGLTRTAQWIGDFNPAAKQAHLFRLTSCERRAACVW